jgi:hypothetical protein
MRTLAEAIRDTDLRLAQHYRQLAWQRLTQARNARWIGHDEPVITAMVRSALQYRRLSHQYASNTRLPSQLRLQELMHQ